MTKNNTDRLAEAFEWIEKGISEGENLNGPQIMHGLAEARTALRDETQPQESKEPLDITPGKWYYSKDQENACTIGNNTVCLFMSNETEVIEGKITIDEVVNNSIGVCRAINSTYGKGYNPEAMEGLYKALEECVERLEYQKITGEWGKLDQSALTESKQALKNAKL
jgi:hypothetical protein